MLVLGLVDRLGLPFTAEIATCLYAGLLTDTGVLPHRRRPARRPTRWPRGCWPPVSGTTRSPARVYDDEPVRRRSACSAGALDRAHLDERAVDGLGLVRTLVTLADRTSLGLPLGAAEGVIDVLRTACEAEVAAVLKEDDDGFWRVSLRSRGRVDVGPVAHRPGWRRPPVRRRRHHGRRRPPTSIATLMAALEAVPRPDPGP